MPTGRIKLTPAVFECVLDLCLKTSGLLWFLGVVYWIGRGRFTGIRIILEKMWLLSGRCRSNARLDGKVVVITGANAGIGKETVLELARRGATVILACRNEKSAQEAIKDIRSKLSREAFRDGKSPEKKVGQLDFVQLDLTSLQSVHKCAETILENYSQVHILINNAGIMACDKALTKDNIELQMGTNHIGHFLLTCILLPRMIQSRPARIINLSSIAHRGGRINFDDFNSELSYSPSFNYAASKLANVLFTRELAKRLKKHDINNVTTYAVHPGIVATGLSRFLSDSVFPGMTFVWDYIMAPFIKTPLQGAQTTLHCALDEDAGHESGYYYSDCKKSMPSRRALDHEAALKLWEKSVEVTKMNWDPFTEQYDPLKHGFNVTSTST